jgi:hypothetical protein
MGAFLQTPAGLLLPHLKVRGSAFSPADTASIPLLRSIGGVSLKALHRFVDFGTRKNTGDPVITLISGTQMWENRVKEDKPHMYF